jgi:hypothetical protein
LGIKQAAWTHFRAAMITEACGRKRHRFGFAQSHTTNSSEKHTENDAPVPSAHRRIQFSARMSFFASIDGVPG